MKYANHNLWNEKLITLEKWEWGGGYDKVFTKFVVGSFEQARRITHDKF
jgi:hypothetical protein